MIRWKPLLISLGISLGVGALSGAVVSDAIRQYQALRQPTGAPPAWLFPVVWTVLFFLMGISAYLVWISDSPERATALKLYGAQLVINFVLAAAVLFRTAIFCRVYLACAAVDFCCGNDRVVLPDGSGCRMAAASLFVLADLCRVPEFGGVPAEYIKSAADRRNRLDSAAFSVLEGGRVRSINLPPPGGEAAELLSRPGNKAQRLAAVLHRALRRMRPARSATADA